ncbi:ATP-dependent Lon protease [Martiniozyma asiatica (nom. inval.)]|nr:ATP-dependent Lon protease [Martiniozyma asiatica]
MLAASRRMVSRTPQNVFRFKRLASRLSGIQTQHLISTGVLPQPIQPISPSDWNKLVKSSSAALESFGKLDTKTPIKLKSKDSEKNDNVPQESNIKEDSNKDEAEDNDKAPTNSETEKSIDEAKSDDQVGSLGAASTSGAASATGGSNNNNDGDGNSNDSGFPLTPTADEISEVYPQILALPITRRPLLPGFYKAVIITDHDVIKAIKALVEKNSPYIACFLFKDEQKESDIIESKDEIFDTGVLCQVTSQVYARDQETGIETLTTVLYPHRRVKVDELYGPLDGSSKVKISEISTISTKKVIEGITGEKEGDEPKAPTEILKEVEQVEEIHDIEHTDKSEEHLTSFLQDFHVSTAKVSNIENEEVDSNDPMVISLINSILEQLKAMSVYNKSLSDQLSTFSATLSGEINNHPDKLADFCAATASGSQKDLQDILECTNITERLQLALEVMKKETMQRNLQRQIEEDIQERMTKRHKEYHLNEQLKLIKKELGIDDGRDKLIAKFKERADKLKMPEEVKKVFNEEVTKLSTLETVMSEYTVTRNYLDWLTQVPWGLQSKDSYNIKRAKRVLDEDHYGLKDVKDRIIEFIAVGKLLNKINGKIICFVGPPGVGKTSIGKSIAKSLNREFYRFSVGGLSDVAEIKGHRRTYVGAIPGRVVQALKKTQTENPLILIDEIDKISSHHSASGGDPAAALLELLDPEQNGTFMDHYMDVPMDLSKVLFVCTANSLSTIPGPLLDRMEVIEISGYIEDEKIQIAEKYLAPEAKKNAGLENANVELTEPAIKALIKNYCRESGVRNLKKQIDKIYRKAALNVVNEIDINEVDEELECDKEKIVSSDETRSEAIEAIKQANTDKENTKEAEAEADVKEEQEEVSNALEIPESYHASITPENLKDFVGVPVFTTDRMYEVTPPGVVMGLAWTSMGGSALYIESILKHAINKDSNAELERTGQLGDVMKESTRIAYSFSRMFLAKHFPENKFFERAQIHLHCPEGATPKDGPSAGITITSSFLSLALNKPLRPDVAMTGEITLTGKVLRIGGLKEKAIAAKRSGVKTILFPKDNESDWKELPDNVKEGLRAVPVDWYEDVFAELFQVGKDEGNLVWKKEFEEIENEMNKEKK